MEEQWYSMRDVCKYFGVCNDTVMYWIKNRNFPAEKQGYYWRFKKREVEKWRGTEDATNTRAYKSDQEGVEATANARLATRPAVSYKPLFKMLIDLGLKKKDLAELAEISMATITKMGRVGSHINTDVLERICLALDCKIGDVLEIIQVSDRDLLMDEMEAEKEETVELNAAACEEYGLTQTEQEIVHFIHEQLQYYRDNPPSFMIDQVRSEKSLTSFEEAKRNIPTDRFYSLVFNDVIDRWGQDGCSFGKKQVPFSLIESGYFESEEESLGEMIMT